MANEFVWLIDPVAANEADERQQSGWENGQYNSVCKLTCVFGIDASNASLAELGEQTDDGSVVDTVEELGLPDEEIKIIERKKVRKRRKIEGLPAYLFLIARWCYDRWDTLPWWWHNQRL